MLQATGNTRPWIEALALFDRLADLAPEDCEKELGTLTRENPELFRHVMTLLRAHWDAKGGAFHTLLSPPTGGHTVPPSTPLAPGLDLGPYRIESALGHGGMGEVWLARRSDGLFQAPVALKLLHAHLQTSSIRERFVREGRILGQLSHPNIARLLDAGALPDTRLYLAIEYVEGDRLDHWCDARKQTIAERVRLFLQVCDAVSHAHARLAVHRDLKPSNILVTPRGDIKLLDFGIAKLMETDKGASEVTELTKLGGRALTPEYAAPEQILGKPITVATDIYSLGMVLYGILTGRRAYGQGTETPAQLERAVVETEPPPPSQFQRVPGGDTLVEDTASLRGTTAPEMRRALKGDLDTILLKALKKNPAERYASVAAFADDLRCHLEDRPVSAQPDSAAYRVEKFVRRHRIGVAAGAAVTAAVIAGVSGIVFQAREAQRARTAAEAAEHRATQRSEEADDLIGFMLGDLKPQLEGFGRLEVLDATVSKAMAYVGTGDFSTNDARALRRRAQAWTMLSELHTARGQFADAMRAGQEAMDVARALQMRAPGDEADEFLAGAIYAFGEPSLENGAFERTRPLTLEGVGIAERLLATPRSGRALMAARLHDQLGYTLAYGPTLDNPSAESHWQRCIDLLRPVRSTGTAQELRYLLACEASRLINLGYHETPTEVLEPAITLVTGDGRDARMRFPDDREILARVITGMAASINALSGLGREHDSLAVADEALALAEQAYAFDPGKIGSLRNLMSILRDRIAIDTRAGRASPHVLRARALHAADQLAKRDPDNRDSLTMSATAVLGLFKQIANDPAKRAEAIALASRASRTGRLEGAIELDLEPIASLELLRQSLQPSASADAMPALDALQIAIKAAGRSDWDAARAYAEGHVAEGDALRGAPITTAYRWVVRWLRDQACARSSKHCPRANPEGLEEPPAAGSSPGTVRGNGAPTEPAWGGQWRRVSG